MASNQILRLIDDEGCPRRSFQRRSVMLVAKLVTPGAEYGIRIRDISATGARVEGDKLPPEGSDVILKRGFFSVFGRLAWNNGRDGGVIFDEPRDEDRLLEELKGLPPSSEEASAVYRRPGFDHRTSGLRWSDGCGWVDPNRLTRRS